MAVGDVYTVSDVGHVNASDPIVNVFQVRDTDGAGSITDLLTKWESHGWFSQIKAQLSQDFKFDVVNARLLIPYGTGTQFIPHTTYTEGASADRVMALNAAAVITWYTGFIGRSKRGRTFLGGLGETQNLLGLFNPGYDTALAALINTFFLYWKTGGGSTHYELGVWSRKTAGHPPPFSPAAFTPCTQYVLREAFRSQRRRNYGISIGRGA